MAVNQIKQYEVALQDETKTGWIVGYIPNNWAGATVEPKVIVPANADYTVAGLKDKFGESSDIIDENEDWGENEEKGAYI